jgi:hypothetical protein
MSSSFPNGHTNPETRYEGVVYSFTDKAIVPPLKGRSADTQGPPVTPPPESDASSEQSGGETS